jgi:hypothetical protein
VTVDLRGLSSAARQLSVRWQEQSLLDSKGAEETLAELESELTRIEPRVDSLLDRQREIATQLRSMRKS